MLFRSATSNAAAPQSIAAAARAAATGAAAALAATTDSPAAPSLAAAARTPTTAAPAARALAAASLAPPSSAAAPHGTSTATSRARPVAQHTASSARRRGPARAARVVATAVTSPIQPSPDVVDASRAASSAACTVACFVRKDALSFMRYPKSLAARGRFDVEGPSFGEVFEHLARRVAWSDADEGTLRMIVVDVDASDEEMRASGASDADVFIAIDVDDEETAGRVRRATASAATG